MELPSDEPFNPCGHSRGHGKWLRGRICPAAHKESNKTPAGAHLDLHRRDLFDPVTSVRTVLEAELALQVSSTKKRSSGRSCTGHEVPFMVAFIKEQADFTLCSVCTCI